MSYDNSYYCYIVIYTFIQHHNDTIIKTHEGRKTQEEFFRKIFTSHFIARVRKGCWRVASERMLETEHKLHILTPLLWPSRCVFLVLLMLRSTPSGVSEVPLGQVLPSLPHLVSNPLGVCWQLHRGGFRGPPSVGCGLLYHIWSLLSGILLATASAVSEVPLGRVWPSLPHLVSNPLGVCWQLLWHPKLNWVK